MEKCDMASAGKTVKIKCSNYHELLSQEWMNGRY